MLLARPWFSAPFSAGPEPSSESIALTSAQSGWVAWTYSKQAKLNAWAWHGLGTTGGKVYAWATIGTSLYLRRDSDDALYVMRPDRFYEAGETNAESRSVYADTQWMDFGKPGLLKNLTGIDFDGVNVTAVWVYCSEDGGRSGSLMEVVPIIDAQGGWTYSGGIVPLNSAGTEFKLRFIGDPNLEVQVNRMTLHWDSMGDA